MGSDAAFAETFWPLFTAVGSLVVALGASAHVVLYKRDSRAAVAWVGLIWLVPFLGSVLYVLLGINRVRRRVSGRRGHESAHVRSLQPFYCGDEQVASLLPEGREYLVEMVRLGRAITDLNLLKGNTVEPLIDGDETYPAMLEAIDRAERSVSLNVYIFDNDAVGRRFLEALSRAVGRGVEVRVLIDAVGARYSMPPITRELTARGVRTARFMSGVLTWRTPYINLRNHRKICVIDGVTAFTGGMNIRAGHLLAEWPAHPTRDIHFRVSGPLVHQLQATFVEDWLFTTGELLSGELWFPSPRIGPGSVCARVVPDGPDHHMDRMSMAFQGALAVARHSVRIVTPYFLPERALIAALNTCALRGVTVDIVLPRLSNLRMVSWAAMAQMWQILEWGCRVWLTPPPFDHSKLMVVDGTLSLVGSSNWDPRSLRLNFELGVECYDEELARRLDAVIEERMNGAERLTRAEADGRPLPVKLRDGVVRLAAPYL
ncbi:MAG: cardiolipin synthase [Spirochaetes bacterium]|jgi:cardiolipin synthase|nr:cardiolipin synthase [Spirochaetota bacterium]